MFNMWISTCEINLSDLLCPIFFIPIWSHKSTGAHHFLHIQPTKYRPRSDIAYAVKYIGSKTRWPQQARTSADFHCMADNPIEWYTNSPLMSKFIRLFVHAAYNKRTVYCKNGAQASCVFMLDRYTAILAHVNQHWITNDIFRASGAMLMIHITQA